MLPTLLSEDDKRPRFEYYPGSSPTLRTVYVDQTPFTIGRGEESDLQISSTGVSRVHAELKRAAGCYRLRDLGSTNGSFVNGHPIEETVLHDGDAVRIADVELTFVCSSLGRLQRMATQPLANQQSAARDCHAGDSETIQRTLNEALLWLAIPIERTAIVDLPLGARVATVASIGQPLSSTLQAAQSCRPCSASGRIQDLAWTMAVDSSNPTEAGRVVLLRVEQAARVGDGALHAFQQAQAVCAESLGVHLPWEWVNGVAGGLTVCSRLKSLGAVLSLEGFSGGAQCVEELADCPPDFVVLAPKVVRDVAKLPRRRQRLEITQAACDAAGIRLVLPDGVAAADRTTCRALDISLSYDVDLSPGESPRLAVAAQN